MVEHLFEGGKRHCLHGDGRDDLNASELRDTICARLVGVKAQFVIVKSFRNGPNSNGSCMGADENSSPRFDKRIIMLNFYAVGRQIFRLKFAPVVQRAKNMFDGIFTFGLAAKPKFARKACSVSICLFVCLSTSNRQFVVTATVELSGRPSKHHSQEDSSAKPAVGIMEICPSWECRPKSAVRSNQLSLRDSFFDRTKFLPAKKNRRTLVRRIVNYMSHMLQERLRSRTLSTSS